MKVVKPTPESPTSPGVESQAHDAAGIKKEVQPVTESDPLEVVRALVMATRARDKESRAERTAGLDITGWVGVSLILAVVKHILVRREKLEMDRVGLELWLSNCAADITESHREWMRLQKSQVVAMLRSGIGDRDLALRVAVERRGRLDSVIVEHLLWASSGRDTLFERELDDVLSEAAAVLSRRALAEAFEGL